MLAQKICDFYFALPDTLALPENVALIYPFDDSRTREAMCAFYTRYYSDDAPRTAIFGINPGRFGAGMTGVGFTDPVLLQERYGIPNDLPKRTELSAQFVYEVVEAYGGPDRFYRDFYFTTVFPLGLLKEGKNYNYYDDKATLTACEPLIAESIAKQMAFGNLRRHIVSIGRGKNLKYLESFNKKYQLFDNISVIPHPRWVMQYRRKQKAHYIREYIEVLQQTL